MWKTTIKCTYASCVNHALPVEVQAPGQLPTSGWVVVKRTKIQLNALRDKAPRRVEVMEAFCSVACAVRHLAAEVGLRLDANGTGTSEAPHAAVAKVLEGQ